MLAYHFTSDKLRDGRPIPRVGETLYHDGEIIPCEQGLHASLEAFDALKYAPGENLHLVTLSGVIIPHGKDKVVASERTILKSFNATNLLRKFACDQALSVKHLWDMPKIVEEYLTAQDETKRVAAWYAAKAAAVSDAARTAAWYAAWYAARYAAWTAARTAAWYAAWYAARTAAASDAAKAEFNMAVEKEFNKIG